MIQLYKGIIPFSSYIGSYMRKIFEIHPLEFEYFGNDKEMPA